MKKRIGGIILAIILLLVLTAPVTAQDSSTITITMTTQSVLEIEGLKPIEAMDKSFSQSFGT